MSNSDVGTCRRRYLHLNKPVKCRDVWIDAAAAHFADPHAAIKSNASSAQEDRHAHTEAGRIKIKYAEGGLPVGGTADVFFHPHTLTLYTL